MVVSDDVASAPEAESESELERLRKRNRELVDLSNGLEMEI